MEIILRFVNEQALNQREKATKGRNIDDDLDDSDARGWRQLLLDGWDQSNVAKNHGCDGSESGREIVWLEKDG